MLELRILFMIMVGKRSQNLISQIKLLHLVSIILASLILWFYTKSVVFSFITSWIGPKRQACMFAHWDSINISIPFSISFKQYTSRSYLGFWLIFQSSSWIKNVSSQKKINKKKITNIFIRTTIMCNEVILSKTMFLKGLT